MEGGTEGPVSHGLDMSLLAGAGSAGYLKMSSTQEGFLEDEETLAGRDLPIGGTKEVRQGAVWRRIEGSQG